LLRGQEKKNTMILVILFAFEAYGNFGFFCVSIYRGLGTVLGLRLYTSLPGGTLIHWSMGGDPPVQQKSALCFSLIFHGEIDTFHNFW
jgi:hypothetical protein